MLRPAAALAALILAAPLAMPQDGPTPPPGQEVPPAEAKPALFPLAEAANGFVACEQCFGLYLNTKNIGRARVTVTAGVPDGFHVEGEMLVEFAGQKESIREQFDLTPGLGLVRYRAIRQRGERPPETLELKRDADGKGTQIRTRAKADGEAGEPRTTAVEIPADLVPERMCYLVLGRVAWAEGARYEVHTEDNVTPVSVVARHVAEETVDVRGRKVSAIRVEAGRSGSGKAHVYHVAGGQVIQIAPAGAPIRLVAGTAAECAADLPDTDPEAAVVRKVAGDFLRGFMTADEALVTSSLDVAAVKARWAEHKPDIGALSDEGLLGLLLKGAKMQLERRGAETMKKQVEALAAMLEAKIAGETATVSFPGSGEPIELARKDGAWKVVWWAVFARGN